MTEGWATVLKAGEDWRHVGAAPEHEPVEVIVRSFDLPVLFATGPTPRGPDAKPVVVGAQEGARLSGLHFFVKPATTDGDCRILVRGV
jgi:hypothetical protein